MFTYCFHGNLDKTAPQSKRTNKRQQQPVLQIHFRQFIRRFLCAAHICTSTQQVFVESKDIRWACSECVIMGVVARGCFAVEILCDWTRSWTNNNSATATTRCNHKFSFSANLHKTTALSSKMENFNDKNIVILHDELGERIERTLAFVAAIIRINEVMKKSCIVAYLTHDQLVEVMRTMSECRNESFRLISTLIATIICSFFSLTNKSCVNRKKTVFTLTQNFCLTLKSIVIWRHQLFRLQNRMVLLKTWSMNSSSILFTYLRICDMLFLHDQHWLKYVLH